ncbi:hypothetical protein [Shewanella colwelliana]|uniref:type IVB secretion system protein IcmW n=1 Tax=Shewanella colwelliana TaxID=23 RepID=UPI0022AFD27C|nr:hypothetical protein [Shewanella colwelliana]MCZ4337814.1 hypothetical protein [Shewanella colwelliana]
MLENKEINSWLTSLGSTARAALDAQQREDWPSDDEPAVQEAIENVSERLKALIGEGNKDFLNNVDDSTLLSLLAMFSFPRSLRLLQIIGNNSPEKLSSITKEEFISNESSQAYYWLLNSRLYYTARTALLVSIFSRDRIAIVLQTLMDATAPKQTETTTQGSGNNTPTSNDKAPAPVAQSSGLVEVDDDEIF